MRLLLSAMVAGVLMAAAAPAFGASQSAHDDCNSGDPDRNIAGCTRVAEDVAESGKTRSIAYVGRGLAWHLKGDFDRAITDYSDAIRLNPNNPLAYNNRGLAWRDKGDPDRAIADFTRAIGVNPQPASDLPGVDHVNIYTNRGLAWNAKGDFDRAIADFDVAIRLDRSDAAAYRGREAAWRAKGDFDRAQADRMRAFRAGLSLPVD